ncbi:uncharacterized protein LY89DRAFT_405958 [Mollisia scopiformis]|uniref:Uncharacterized protein n=1 Tax=Mollisia scopiformis TaxID=149040 RepID=A0A132B4I7_MOLSC|nr:uncharacterized protein LY89DRAFT_405958 [Mollisia scopiformis]KUJ06577.1 hypothetical protein LY89DRAFT_405958 [Mollisia scopiformis]
MRMLQTVLWHQWSGSNPICNQILSEIQNSLGHLCDSLLSGSIFISAPTQLCQRGSTRPHLPTDHSIVDLLAPERRSNTYYPCRFRGCEVGGEIVVVDTLPGLVWCTPRSTISSKVEICQPVNSVRVDHHVISRIVRYPAAETAVQTPGS